MDNCRTIFEVHFTEDDGVHEEESHSWEGLLKGKEQYG
jgi:hypothetical protein